MGVARGWGRGHGEVLFEEHRISVWDEEFWVDDSDDCRITWMYQYLTLQNCTLKKS